MRSRTGFRFPGRRGRRRHRDNRLRQSTGKETSNRQMNAGAPDRIDEVLGPLVRRGYRLAVTMLENRAAAEDAVQEASIKAWRNFGTLRDAEALEPWYLSIVANQCRGLRRNRWCSVQTVDAPQGQDCFDEDRSVAVLDLEQELDRLDPEDRTALFLHYYLDLTFEQAAQVMGDATGAAGADADRGGVHQRTDRGPSVHQPPDRPRPHALDLCQARRRVTQRRHALGPGTRPDVLWRPGGRRLSGGCWRFTSGG